MDYSLKTHEGKRKDNQDYARIFFNQSNLMLAVLCDGLGGHQAGDIASEMAVSQIGNAWTNTEYSSNDIYIVQNWLNKAINKENTRIFDAASTYSDLEGMGTTLVACVIFEEFLLFANIGDSRAYIFKDKNVQLITEDHSFVSELQRSGELSDLEALNHYNRNALTRSLGVEGEIKIDFFKVPMENIEAVMLNSDGLSNAVAEVEMNQIFKQKNRTIDEKASLLVKKAIENEASDNVTVSLIDLKNDSNEGVGENE